MLLIENTLSGYQKYCSASIDTILKYSYILLSYFTYKYTAHFSEIRRLRKSIIEQNVTSRVKIRCMKDNISSWCKNFILPLRHIFKPLLTFTFEICSICGWMWAQRIEMVKRVSICGWIQKPAVPLDCSTIEASAYRGGRSWKWALKRPYLHIHLQEMRIVPVIIYSSIFIARIDPVMYSVYLENLRCRLVDENVDLQYSKTFLKDKLQQ